MIKTHFYRWAPFFLLLLYTGCAGSKTGNEGFRGNSYTTQLGVAFRDDFSGVANHILVNKYHYRIIRAEESSRQIYMETEWKNRAIFDDEVVMGITAAQTRFTITAQARHTGQYKLSFLGENQFQFVDATEWRRGPLSKMAREHFIKIADDLRTEYRLLY